MSPVPIMLVRRDSPSIGFYYSHFLGSNQASTKESTIRSFQNLSRSSIRTGLYRGSVADRTIHGSDGEKQASENLAVGRRGGV